MARIPLQIASRSIDAGPMVNYGGVSRSPVGQALQSFGGEVQGLSSQLSAIETRRREQREEVENFETMQQLDRMELAVQGDLAQVQQKIPPSGMGYHDTAVSTFQQKEQEFLANVPERLKPRLSSILETKRMEFSQKQAAAELELRQGWYRDGVKEKQESLQNQVFNDPATFENAREEGLLAIEASGLPEIEKQALREGWDDTLALTLGEREIRDAEANPDSANDVADRLGVRGATGSPVEQFVDRIIQVESGGRSNAKNPNSTATGPGQFINSTWLATVKKYRPDVARGRSDAQILSLRTDQALSREMTTAYAQENANFLANQGVEGTAGNIYLAHFLGPRGAAQVLKAAPGTPIVNIVGNEVVRANGFLRGKTAADVIAWSDKKMGGSGSVAGGQPADPRYANLPLDKRLEIFDRANAAANRGRTAFAAQEKAAYDSYKGSLELGIETGQIASERTILSDPMLTDAHKADLLSSFKTKMADQLATQQAMTAFTQGTLSVDPYSTDGRKTVDRVYDALTQTADAEQIQPATENLISTTGILPTAYHNQIRAGLESQNLAEVEAAAARASRINAMNPAILSRRDGGSEIQKMADQYDYLVNTRGMSSADATKRMVESRTRDYKTNETVLGPAADKLLKDLSVGDITGEFATGFFGFGAPGAGVDPTTENALLSEYREAFREEFILSGGDEAIARAAATGEIKRTWGESSLTGDRQLMKYPPERFYPQVGGGHTYLADDMRTTAEELALADDSVEALGRVWLRPSPATAADIRAGRPPRYRMFYEYSVNGQTIVDEAPGYWGMPADRIDESRAGARQQSMQDAEAAREFLSDRQEVPADQRMNFIEQEERINENIRNRRPPELTPMREAPASQRQLGSIGSAADVRSTTNQMLQDFRGNR